jgi:hypothetical protein
VPLELRSEAAVATYIIRGHGEISQTAFVHLENLLCKGTVILQRAAVRLETLIYKAKVILQRAAVRLETLIYKATVILQRAAVNLETLHTAETFCQFGNSFQIYSYEFPNYFVAINSLSILLSSKVISFKVYFSFLK